MQQPDDHYIADELAACETRIRMAERELELLAHLPTAAWFTALERLNHERKRLNWLQRPRRFGHSERVEERR